MLDLKIIMWYNINTIKEKGNMKKKIKEMIKQFNE
jgi:hypothetical protein